MTPLPLLTTELLDNHPDGVTLFDAQLRYVYVNGATERMLGLTIEQMRGQYVWDLYPPTPSRMPFIEAINRAHNERVATSVEAYNASRHIWYEVQAFPYQDGLAVLMCDVSPRRQKEAQQQYMADASRALSSSLDYEQTLAQISSLAVPEVADWCSITLVSEDGRLERTAVAHTEEWLSAYTKELEADYPADLNAPAGVGAVIRTGTPLVVSEVTEQVLRMLSTDERHFALLNNLGMHSGMIVPMRGLTRIVGAVTFVSSNESRRFSEADLPFVEELASRAALAVENARLYALSRRAEEELRGANEHLEERIAERTQALAAANRLLEIRNRELQDFAYVASHDLQEPLRKIQAFAGILANAPAMVPDEEGRHMVERMQTAAERMSRLIKDLLAFSRVTTYIAPTQAVDLGDVLQGVLADLEARLLETGGQVEVEGVLPRVVADPLQMHQLLVNLVGNALKFHRKGVPPVVRVRGQVTGSKALQLTVEDNGIGFEAKHGERIFAPFQRLHTREAYEGTGIGLAIVRRIIERHGGTIRATSVPGQGSCFVVTLPLAA